MTNLTDVLDNEYFTIEEYFQPVDVREVGVYLAVQHWADIITRGTGQTVLGTKGDTLPRYPKSCIDAAYILVCDTSILNIALDT